jgi:hypothetical protein
MLTNVCSEPLVRRFLIKVLQQRFIGRKYMSVLGKIMGRQVYHELYSFANNKRFIFFKEQRTVQLYITCSTYLFQYKLLVKLKDFSLFASNSSSKAYKYLFGIQRYTMPSIRFGNDYVNI